MITGGTGSFGNAVLNRFLKTDIAEIRIFSRDEKKQDDMRHEYQAKMPEVAHKIKFYIGDVRSLESCRAAMPGVDYIFHAAALKQVPSCEFFPLVTAILMLAVEKRIVPPTAAFIPLCLFYLLDCYYLGLERKFKDRLRDFIIRINEGKDVDKDIYLSHSTDDKCWIVRRLCSIWHQILSVIDGMFSFSTTIVYGALALSIYFIGKI